APPGRGGLGGDGTCHLGGRVGRRHGPRGARPRLAPPEPRERGRDDPRALLPPRRAGPRLLRLPPRPDGLSRGGAPQDHSVTQRLRISVLEMSSRNSSSGRASKRSWKPAGTVTCASVRNAPPASRPATRKRHPRALIASSAASIAAGSPSQKRGSTTRSAVSTPTTNTLPGKSSAFCANSGAPLGAHSPRPVTWSS